MARIDTEGIDELLSSMNALYLNTDELQDEILDESVAIIKERVKSAIQQHGYIKTGDMLKSIKIKKKTSNKYGYKEKARIVTAAGTDRKGDRNGYKAFVLNYGRSDLPGTRYWNKAEQRAEAEITQMAEAKINQEHRKRGLT